MSHRARSSEPADPTAPKKRLPEQYDADVVSEAEQSVRSATGPSPGQERPSSPRQPQAEPKYSQNRGLGEDMELDDATAEIALDGWMGNVAVCEVTCLAKGGCHVHHVCTTACACYGLCEERRQGILKKSAEVGKEVFGNEHFFMDMHSAPKSARVGAGQRNWDLEGRGSARVEEVAREDATDGDGPADEVGASAEEGASAKDGGCAEEDDTAEAGANAEETLA
jgi:hypothetical protein